MALFDSMKYDRHARGAQVDEETRLELRRLANLFLLSSVTLIILLLEVAARSLHVDFLPGPVYAVGGLVFLVGWAATFVYGIFVTFKAARWGWFVLCLIPVTCVPASVAYAWIRRGEIEREVLAAADARDRRRSRGGKRD